MRQSPMNYLIAVGVSAALWLLTAILLGGFLGDSVSLQQMAVEDFLARYRIIMGVAAGLGTITLFAWLQHGSNSEAGAELRRSRRLWTILLISLLVLVAILLTVFTVTMLAEALESGTVIMIGAALFVHTVLYFWVCSLLVSPERVKFVVPGARV